MLWLLIKWLFSFQREKTTFGSSKFLTGMKRWRVINPFNKGFVIDGRNKISIKKSRQHVVVTAATGQKKTVTTVLPNLLKLNGPSVIVTDPSGELLRKSKGYLRSKRYIVKALDFSNPAASAKYNPIHRATGSQIDKLASILVDSAFPESKGDAFWNDSAKTILSLIIKAVKRLPEHQQNLGEVYRILNKFGHKQEEVNQLISETLDDRSFEIFAGFLSQDSKVLNSVLSTAKTTLNKFSDETIDLLTSRETLHFESIRSKQRTAIFICVPEHEISYYSFILTILYTQLFHFCMTPPKQGQKYNDIFFLMEELGNSGKLPGFSTIITTARKRKVSILAVLQDYEQLVHIYGKSDASTIYNGGFNTKIFFPGLSLQSSEELSRILGKRTLTMKESGYSDGHGGAASNRDRELGRELMTPSEIRTMKKNRAICITGSELPILLKTTPWYKNRKLRRRTKL